MSFTPPSMKKHKNKLKIHYGHSSWLGPIGVHCTPSFLYIHQYLAPEGFRLATIPWAQIRTIKLCPAKFRFRSNRSHTLVVSFHRGRLPESMIKLMIEDHRLVVTFLDGANNSMGSRANQMLQEMIQIGGLVKISSKWFFWKVHYEPPHRTGTVNSSRDDMNLQISECDFD